MDSEQKSSAFTATREGVELSAVYQKACQLYSNSLSVDERIPEYLRARLDASLSAFGGSVPNALIRTVEEATAEEAADLRHAWEQVMEPLRQQLYRLPNLLEYHDRMFRQYSALQQQEGNRRYLFCSEQSGNSCAVCQAHHGEVLSLAELAQQGLIPPLHPNCRCKLVAMDSGAEMIYNRDRYWFLDTVGGTLDDREGSIFLLRPEYAVFGISPMTLTGLDLPDTSAITDGEGETDPWRERFLAWAAKFGGETADMVDAFLLRGQDLLHNAAEVSETNPLWGAVLFLDALTGGIASGIAEGTAVRWNAMLEDFNLYTLANFFTMGTVQMVDGAVSPEEPWSLQHVLDVIGTLTLFYALVRGVRARREQSQGLGGHEGGPMAPKDPAARAADGIDDQLDGIAQQYGDVVGVTPADELNDIYLRVHPEHQPPYWPGSTTVRMQLSREKQFVRVFGGNSQQIGPWLMRADDIAGLTAQQIQEMFSLPQVPSYICDVSIPAGTILDVSGANAILGGTGGGIQFFINGDSLESWFFNPRLID